MENMLKTIGSWLFLIGILLSVLIGIALGAELWTNQTWVATLLAVLGFIVGVLSFFAVGNITQERVPTFLIAALMLVGIGATTPYFTNIDYIGPYLASIAGMLAVFVAPAAGILAIRAIWDAGKTEDIEKIIPKIPQK
ncbi:MAG: hypothetical protein KKG04_03275 [Candidatus Thermoplasmatota archaeon]|nr:hypothetical protein [Candidatus Thermoplasmatota archaeon]